ncbi:hypothetical protein ACWF82_17935 [Nocardia sp. NPDC055053]
MIEDIWKERRGVRSDDNLTHLFLRAESRDDLVVVVVCRKTVNVGMLFAQSRRVLVDAGRL